MNIQELDQQHLDQVEIFVGFYCRSRKLMQAQERQPDKKISYFENEISDHYRWLTKRVVPSQISILQNYGYSEVLQELETFIKRFGYKTI